MSNPINPSFEFMTPNNVSFEDEVALRNIQIEAQKKVVNALDSGSAYTIQELCMISGLPWNDYLKYVHWPLIHGHRVKEIAMYQKG